MIVIKQQNIRVGQKIHFVLKGAVEATGKLVPVVKISTEQECLKTGASLVEGPLSLVRGCRDFISDIFTGKK